MEHILPKDVEKYVEGLSFPASKDDILAHAKEQGASQEILDVIDTFSDKRYKSEEELHEAILGYAEDESLVDEFDDEIPLTDDVPLIIPDDDETGIDIPKDDDRSF